MSVRRIAMASVLVCIVFAAGCGSADSDEDKAAQVVRAWFAALADGDGASACGYLTDDGQRQLLQLVFADLPVEEHDTCAENVERMSDGFDHKITRALRDAKVTAALQDRDTATATVEGSPVTPTVRKGVDGEWRIDEGLFD